MKGIVEILLLILLVVHPEAGVSSVPVPTPILTQETRVLGVATKSALVNSINSIRASHGVAPLKISYLLNKSASNRACYLYKNNIWSHEGEGYVKFFAQVGYLPHPKWIGENLARNFGSDQEMINAWVGSSIHLTNILDGRFVEIGIGKCYTYTVAHFGGK